MVDVNATQPAFPTMTNEPGDNGPWNKPGLTKREWLAGQIAAGMVASDSNDNPIGNLRDAATRATVFADALLAELAKGESP